MDLVTRFELAIVITVSIVGWLAGLTIAARTVYAIVTGR